MGRLTEIHSSIVKPAAINNCLVSSSRQQEYDPSVSSYVISSLSPFAIKPVTPLITVRNGT
jgi:hypothetical protein